MKPILTKAEQERESVEPLPVPRSLSAEERLMRLTDEARRILPTVMCARAYVREAELPASIKSAIEAALIDADRLCRRVNTYGVEGY